jgi:N-acyl-L-homoserine lactone synthetase
MLNKIKLWVASLIVTSSKVSFKEAVTKEELDLVYKLRYEIYLGEGYISSDNSGRFKDVYDDYSVNFLIYNGRVSIGTFRLILNSQLGFWTEAIFNFVRPNLPREQIAEISRFGILKEFRGGKAVMLGLIGTVYKQSKKRGINYIYFNVPEKLAKRIGSFGIPLSKLEELPPTQEIFKNRSLIGGYFKKSKLEPYMIELREAEKSFSLL